MKRLAYPKIVRATAALCIIGISSVLVAQPPNASERPQKLPVRPRQPGGILKDSLGIYLTIEGTLYDGKGKVESNTLVVDTVDGNKLDETVMVLVRNLRLPAKTRCILKGYELGAMIGSPPALRQASKEQGQEYVEQSAAAWRWRPYFVPLLVVEPLGLEEDDA